jgi:hypothetical protein
LGKNCVKFALSRKGSESSARRLRLNCWHLRMHGRSSWQILRARRLDVIGTVMDTIIGKPRRCTILPSYPSLLGFEICCGPVNSIENYQHLYVNRAYFNVDLATVESNFLSPPEAAIDEMVDSNREMIPYASEVNCHRFQPTPALPPSLMDLRLIPLMMKMKMLLLVLPNRKKLYIFFFKFCLYIKQ